MRKANIIRKSILYLILILLSVVCLLPFYWMLRSSLMDVSQIFVMPPIWFPHPIKFSNYKEALSILPFGRYFLNTFYIVAFVVSGTIITSSLCAYSFARIRWKGRDFVFGILMTALMLPYAVTLIPTFIGWHALGFYGTYVPLTVP
ncbi:MAG TPA: sugar ABC transporter ATP-binding protein, partial [Clostridiaceae bacterium]|nr:sugar ABC transporter ATP-binding protein [Clostridiaceae bacterium]